MEQYFIVAVCPISAVEKYCKNHASWSEEFRSNLRSKFVSAFFINSLVATAKWHHIRAVYLCASVQGSSTTERLSSVTRMSARKYSFQSSQLQHFPLQSELVQVVSCLWAFAIILSISKQMPGLYFRLCDRRFLPRPLLYPSEQADSSSITYGFYAIGYLFNS